MRLLQDAEALGYHFWLDESDNIRYKYSGSDSGHATKLKILRAHRAEVHKCLRQREYDRLNKHIEELMLFALDFDKSMEERDAVGVELLSCIARAQRLYDAGIGK